MSDGDLGVLALMFIVVALFVSYMLKPGDDDHLDRSGGG